LTKKRPHDKSGGVAALFNSFYPSEEEKIIMKGVTEKLAQFIAKTKFEDLPDKVIHEVKRNLLDTIGCALGGLTTDIGLESLVLVETVGGRPESTILGTGKKTSCTLAAYANSRMANALDADETLPVPTHFANATMGASLALGEQKKISGKELITAYAVGYELASRIAVGIRPPIFMKKKDTPGYPSRAGPTVFMVFGGLGAASKVLNLKADQVHRAIGIAVAGCPIAVLGKWSESIVLPTLKYGDAGWCAQLGVTASLLANIGTTSLRDILDEEKYFWGAYGVDDCDFEGVIRDLGQEWHIFDTTYKPWPGCRYVHYPLWLFLKIKEENHLSSEDIEKVLIRMGRITTTKRFENQSPIGPITCQFNHPHTIAVGALGIEPGPKWYSPQTMNDKRIIEFRKRVEVQYDPELDKIDIPQGKILWKFPTSVEVMSKKGVFRASTEYVKGDPWTEETYFTDDELKKKFLIFASSVFDGSEKWLQQMDSVIDMVFNAEKLVNVAELCDSLGPRSLST
jgi:2-methylcitrate dehydratase PrpD